MSCIELFIKILAGQQIKIYNYFSRGSSPAAFSTLYLNLLHSARPEVKSNTAVVLFMEILAIQILTVH